MTAPGLESGHKRMRMVAKKQQHGWLRVCGLGVEGVFVFVLVFWVFWGVWVFCVFCFFWLFWVLEYYTLILFLVLGSYYSYLYLKSIYLFSRVYSKAGFWVLGQTGREHS